MSGFRVSVDIHHLDDQADGREWMLVFNGWLVWRLTDDEARRLHADLARQLEAHADPFEHYGTGARL